MRAYQVMVRYGFILNFNDNDPEVQGGILHKDIGPDDEGGPFLWTSLLPQQYRSRPGDLLTKEITKYSDAIGRARCKFYAITALKVDVCPRISGIMLRRQYETLHSMLTLEPNWYMTQSDVDGNFNMKIGEDLRQFFLADPDYADNDDMGYNSTQIEVFESPADCVIESPDDCVIVSTCTVKIADKTLLPNFIDTLMVAGGRIPGEQYTRMLRNKMSIPWMENGRPALSEQVINEFVFVTIGSTIFNAQGFNEKITAALQASYSE